MTKKPHGSTGRYRAQPRRRRRTISQAATSSAPNGMISPPVARAAVIAKPSPAQYVHIKKELRWIGILAGTMVVILVILAFVLR